MYKIKKIQYEKAKKLGVEIKPSKLKGKKIFCIISTGAHAEIYQEGTKRKFNIRQLLAPIEQMALFCGMTYLPPYAIHDAHKIGIEELEKHSKKINCLLGKISQVDSETFEKYLELNDCQELTHGE